jgi:hypothetical protein
MKDPTHPYAVLDRLALRGARRLVIGHADRCPSVATLRQLAQGEQWLMQAREGQAPAWNGWGSLVPLRLPARCAGMDAAALDALARDAGWPLRLHGGDDGTALDSAAALLQAQAGADEVPASWIRRPWGAMSPLAHVDEGATLVGPVRIGPGCIVERGAQLGPQVVLSRDVVVSAGTRLEHCLVLPGSYIGAGLTLSHAVVNGPRVRHVRWGVESRLAEADALLLDLAPTPPTHGSAAGRALAALALLAVGPALLVHRAWRLVRGRAPDWALRPAVIGPADGRRGLGELLLRGPAPGATRTACAWARAAGLLDVLQGRRAWIGVRPRSAGEWYALRPEWQRLLAGRPIGLLHAPAWFDDTALHAEACAAADVFASVLTPNRRAALVLGAARRR